MLSKPSEEKMFYNGKYYSNPKRDQDSYDVFPFRLQSKELW